MRFGAVAKCVLLKYEYEHNELCVGSFLYTTGESSLMTEKKNCK